MAELRNMDGNEHSQGTGGSESNMGHASGMRGTNKVAPGKRPRGGVFEQEEEEDGLEPVKEIIEILNEFDGKTQLKIINAVRQLVLATKRG